MTAPVTIRRFGPDGLVISETRFNAQALQQQFDDEGLAAKIRRLRRAVPDQPSIPAASAMLLALFAAAVIAVAALPAVPA